MGYPMPVFKTGAIGHSAIPPKLLTIVKNWKAGREGRTRPCDPLDEKNARIFALDAGLTCD
jgi:hypothetical protein